MIRESTECIDLVEMGLDASLIKMIEACYKREINGNEMVKQKNRNHLRMCIQLLNKLYI